jgi:predicted nucleotidyltransferase
MANQNRTNSRTSKKNQITVAVRRRVKDYLQYLQEQGLSIHSAYIFGSHVSGKKHAWSDIDVCVVSPDFGPRKDGISYLWKKLRKQDIKAGIEPVGFHPEEFTDDIPLVHEILQRGVRVI